MKRLALVLAVCGGLLMPRAAQAVLYGNPVPLIAPAQSAWGLSMSEHRFTLSGDIGIMEGGTLLLRAGTVDFDGLDGTEAGLGYKHDLGASFTMGDQPVQLGALALLHIGRAEQAGIQYDYKQFDVGVGGRINPVERLYPFAMVVFNRQDEQVSGPGLATADDTDSHLGISVGTEFWPSPRLALGGELHGGLGQENDDVVVYFLVSF